MTSGSTATARITGRGWFLAGYVGIAGFLGLEALTRQRGSAASLQASDDDRGTTRAIIASYAVAALAAPGLRRLPLPRLPRSAGPVGLALEGIGLAVRAWSMLTLGRSYTRTLRVQDEHPVIDTGPYHLIRHPGYLGSLMIWTGFALTSRSVPVAAVTGALLGGAYRQRIAAEEQLLLRELPGYADYRDRTNRIVPFLP